MPELKLAAIFILFQGGSQPVIKSDELFWIIVILAFLIGITFGIIFTQLFHIIRKLFSNSDTKHEHTNLVSKNNREEQPVKKSHVSLCPVCHSSYTDPNLRYCLSDGSLLFVQPKAINKDPEETLVLPKR